MDKLYDKLWDKNLPAIKDPIFTTPQSGHQFHPGYRVCIEATEYETFLNPEFALKESEKSLKMLKIKSALPCKKN